MTTMTIAKAINEGLRAALTNHPKSLLMGEDIGPLGGVYRVTDGLIAEFGPDRVVDTPLAESGIIGTAIGLALRGYSPVCEIQFDGFVFPGFNQITTQLAKMHARSNGNLTVPVVIRIPYGGGIGSVEHHSESPEALFAHTAGLRIITPSNPHDAYWMIQQAVECQDPVIVFEPKRRYWLKGEVDVEAAGTAQDPSRRTCCGRVRMPPSWHMARWCPWPSPPRTPRLRTAAAWRSSTSAPSRRSISTPWKLRSKRPDAWWWPTRHPPSAASAVRSRPGSANVPSCPSKPP